ncbi:MarR family winged helix-turn-helix transcriptional regulator [Roseixanthobacter pseudopolyaromaticivorans]|uniref:MarR family winged helix-turn-helix transcriptional regulator n=2 Tax=Hyphomicrobiales TaxID=356 RepID=UPI00372B570A
MAMTTSVRGTGPVPADERADAETELTERPGFLIRRLHQIHLAMFYEACSGLNVTPVQSSILTVLARRQGLDQAGLAAMIGVDRATVGQVIRRLAARGLVARGNSSEDKRLKLVHLTDEGRALLDQIAPLTAAAHMRTLAALSDEERAHFMSYLKKLVAADNEHGRAPLRWGPALPE